MALNAVLLMQEASTNLSKEENFSGGSILENLMLFFCKRRTAMLAWKIFGEQNGEATFSSRTAQNTVEVL